MISTHHGVTFHTLGVSSWAFHFELNFDLAHCGVQAIKRNLVNFAIVILELACHGGIEEIYLLLAFVRL